MKSKTTREYAGRLARGVITLAVAIAGLALPSVSGAQSGVSSDRIPLWEVSRDGASIYLLGSVHVLRPESYPLNEALYEAFDAAEVVAFEVDLGAAAEAAPMMMARGIFQGGQTLQTALPPDVYDDLAGRLGTLGMPIQSVAPMKPWLVGLTLNALSLQQVGFDPQLGVDMHFYQRGVRQGKRVIGLETMEDQINVFDSLTAEQQVEFLRGTLDEMDRATGQMEEIATVWATGDIERLSEMLNESLKDQPELTEKLLFERNRNWIPKIEELLAGDEPAIVIVGLGHMVGEGSVTELLSARGYTVERVAPVGAR